MIETTGKWSEPYSAGKSIFIAQKIITNIMKDEIEETWEFAGYNSQELLEVLKNESKSKFCPGI